jgi:hypothetical protein
MTKVLRRFTVLNKKKRTSLEILFMVMNKHYPFPDFTEGILGLIGVAGTGVCAGFAGTAVGAAGVLGRTGFTGTT